MVSLLFYVHPFVQTMLLTYILLIAIVNAALIITVRTMSEMFSMILLRFFFLIFSSGVRE